MRRKRTNIWVEKLGAADVVFLALRYPFPGVTVYYDGNRVAPGARRLLGLLRKAGLEGKFYRADLTLALKDSLGQTLRYGVEKGLSLIAEDFIGRFIPCEPGSFKKAVRSFIGGNLCSRAGFIAMVEAEPRFKECAARGKNVFYFSRHPLNYLLCSFYSRQGYSFSQSLLSLDWLKFYLLPLVYFTAVIIAKSGFSRPKTNVRGVKPSVWVEYSHDDICDFAFWLGHVDKTGFDTVYFIDRSDTFSLNEMTASISKKGLKWIDLRNFELIKTANPGFGGIKSLARSFFGSRVPYAWFRVFSLRYRMQFISYHAIFKRFKVRILIQHQEGLWIQEAQAAALTEAGGIMLGFHWSAFQHNLSARHIYPQHVFFTWGKFVRDYMLENMFCGKYILPSGLWIIPPESKDQGLLSYREKFKFVMAILDSSAAYDIHQSPESLAEFYHMALRLLEREPLWGGIIKSKEFDSSVPKSLPGGRDIPARIKALAGEGRLMVLTRRRSPADIVGYCDIFLCYGMNSAGIIAAACGAKVLHWDTAGWLKHPFYKDPGQKFIFKSLEDLEEAVGKAVKGDSTVGDFSRWRKEFNHFQDFSAAGRVGKFIQDFMAAVKDTDNSRKALDWAVGKYISENKVEGDFFNIKYFQNN